MPVTSLSESADPADFAKPPTPDAEPSSFLSDRPLFVCHKGDVTVVVYSSPSQEPKRLNHPILPSLHIMLVEEGNEIAGLASILADYLTDTPAVTDDLAASNQVQSAIQTTEEQQA